MKQFALRTFGNLYNAIKTAPWRHETHSTYIFFSYHNKLNCTTWRMVGLTTCPIVLIGFLCIGDFSVFKLFHVQQLSKTVWLSNSPREWYVVAIYKQHSPSTNHCRFYLWVNESDIFSAHLQYFSIRDGWQINIRKCYDCLTVMILKHQ